MAKPGLLVIGDSHHPQFDDLALSIQNFDISSIFIPDLKLEDLIGDLLEATEYFNAVVMHVGANNVLGDSVDEMALKVIEMQQKIRKENPLCRIYMCGTLPRCRNNSISMTSPHNRGMMTFNVKAEQMNRKLREICNDSSGSFYIDGPSKFFGVNGEILRHLLRRDGLQLSHHGVKVLLNCFVAIVEFSSFQYLTAHSVATNSHLAPYPSLLSTFDSNCEMQGPLHLSHAKVIDAISSSSPFETSPVFETSVDNCSLPVLPILAHSPLTYAEAVKRPIANPLSSLMRKTSHSLPPSLHTTKNPLPSVSALPILAHSPLTYAEAVKRPIANPLSSLMRKTSHSLHPSLRTTKNPLPSVSALPMLAHSPLTYAEVVKRPIANPRSSLMRKTSHSLPPSLRTTKNPLPCCTQRRDVCGGGGTVIYPRTCDVCTKQYASKQSYSAHIQKGRCQPPKAVSDVLVPNAVGSEEKSKFCTLPGCSFQYRNYPELLKHVELAHKANSSSATPTDSTLTNVKATPEEETVLTHESTQPSKSNLPNEGSVQSDSDNDPDDGDSDDDANSNAELKNLIVCSDCSGTYSNAFSFRRHEKICQSRKQQLIECLDPSCSLSFSKYGQMISHMENSHGADLGVKTLQFNSEDDFYEWKKMEEENSFTCFIKHTRSNVKEDEKISDYICKCDVRHRNRTPKNTPKTDRRKLKGKTITDSNCPARLHVVANSNGVYVKYISRHNHELHFRNVKYYRWPTETKDYINVQLEREVPARKIKEDFAPANVDLTAVHPVKEHFITPKQIHKMKYAFNMKERLHKKDAVSVQLQVENKRDSILLYKPQGEEVVIGDSTVKNLLSRHDSFALGFQTERQRLEMIKGCKKILIIDATHKTNFYDFYLVNLIVPDEFGVGYPVAHFITNHVDTESMMAFFYALKSKTPDLLVNSYITDDDPALYTSFELIFGSGPIHILCKWHVRKAWTGQVSAKIKDPNLVKEVNQCLYTIHEERDIATFQKLLENFLSSYQNSCPIFCKYFSIFYVPRVKKWALCYRNFPHADTDTTNYAESYHNMLKTNYMNRQFNRRVDDLYHIVTISDENLHLALTYKRLTEEEPVGNNNSINSRHFSGMRIPDEDVIGISEIEYEVLSQSTGGVVYLVELLLNACSETTCYIKCDKSCHQLCAHMYRCSCADRNALCKHIHKVHSVHSLNVEISDSTNAEEVDDGEPPNLQFYDPPEQGEIISDEANSERLISSCNKQMKKLEKLFSNSKIQPLLSHIHETLKLLVSKSKGLIHGNAPFAPPPRMKRKPVAPNQKLEKQPASFWQTTQKRKESKKAHALFKSEDEKNLVWSSLLNVSNHSIITFAHQASPVEAEPPINFSGTLLDSDELSKTLFTLCPYDIKLYHLKSLDNNISVSDIRRLQSEQPTFKKGWLYDSIIYAYLVKISESSSPPVKIVDPCASQVIQCPNRDVLGSMDISLYQKIFIPCNPTNSHWVLLVAYPEKKIVHFYDPNSLVIKNQYHQFIGRWLKKLAEKSESCVSDWKVFAPDHICQNDSISCGVYITWYCDQILKNNSTNMKFNVESYRFVIYENLTKLITIN